MDTVSERMKHAFTICGLSQVQVARDMRIGQSTISKWLSGILEPRYVHLLALKDLYGMNPSYLQNGEMPVIHELQEKSIPYDTDTPVQKLVGICRDLPRDKLIAMIEIAEKMRVDDTR